MRTDTRSAGRHMRRRWLTAVSAANLAAMLLCWLAGVFVAERWWPAAIFTYLPQLPLGAPLVALAAVSAVRRDPTALAVNGACILLFLFGPLGFRIHVPRQPPPGRTLRVMTWNIRGATLGLSGIVQTIRDARPDVLCLQEAAAPDPARSPALEERLRAALPGYVGVRAAGQMTLTRLPITAARAEPLLTGRPTRPLQIVEILAGAHRITVLNTHYALGPPIGAAARIGLGQYVQRAIDARMRQSSALIEHAERLAGLQVVCGDFNTPPAGCAYGMLAEHWTNAMAAVGQGISSTFPARAPVTRIDHVWLSSDLSPVSAGVPATIASDHRPVLVVIALPER